MEEPLRLLADMNLSPLTVDALSRDGIDIVRVSTRLSASPRMGTYSTWRGRKGAS